MFEQALKNIDDALRKEAGCTTELDYTEQTSWLLFLNFQNRYDRACLGQILIRAGASEMPVVGAAFLLPIIPLETL